MERLTRFIWLAMCCTIAVACGNDATAPRSDDSVHVGEESPSPFEVASPLDGVWVARFTCQDVVRALKRADGLDHIATAMQSLEPGPPPPKDDPCRGAPAIFERTYTFQGNHLVGYTDAEGIGLDVIVRLTDNGFVIPGDPGQPDSEFSYELNGDHMTVRCEHQKWWGFHASWEMGSFERQS